MEPRKIILRGNFPYLLGRLQATGENVRVCRTQLGSLVCLRVVIPSQNTRHPGKTKHILGVSEAIGVHFIFPVVIIESDNVLSVLFPRTTVMPHQSSKIHAITTEGQGSPLVAKICGLG